MAKSFLKQAFDDMKESAKEQRKIDKENIEAIKKDNKEMKDALKNYKADDLNEFKKAEGLKGKVKVLAGQMRRDAKKTAEENRENYKKLQEEQRKNIKDITIKYKN